MRINNLATISEKLVRKRCPGGHGRVHRSPDQDGHYPAVHASCGRLFQGSGPQWRRCTCPKWIYLYRDGKDSRVSAKTRSWEKAEQHARDSTDPVKRPLKALAERLRRAEAEEITISSALERWGGLEGKERR